MVLSDSRSRIVVGVIFGILVVTCRVTYFIITPLWLDYFSNNTDISGNDTNTSDFNVDLSGRFYVEALLGYRLDTDVAAVQNAGNSSGNNGHKVDGISIYFLLIFQWGFCTALYGILFLAMVIFAPQLITDVERQYPKKQIIISGFAMGVSSLLFNYSVSGSRTPPYLSAILANFNIPIQFITRFVILRKRSTWLKLSCAGIILLAEFICLLPTIFPSLESSSDHKQDGGTSGVAGILWPMCMVISMIPFAIANNIIEKGVQDDSQTKEKTREVNLVFYTFWWSLCVFITVSLFIWTDIIPQFGTSKNWQDFTNRFSSDTRCLVGLEGCGPEAYMLGWANFIVNSIAAISIPGLLRYSEGANFAIILLTLRTPLVFIFWTLFLESPFQWHPHPHLSTWLSIGAICIMIPAIVVYNIGKPNPPQVERSESTESLLTPTPAGLPINFERHALETDHSVEIR